MRKTEVKEVTEKKVVTVGVTCDCCGKEIKGKYWQLELGGMYSDCDIDYDLCSKKCVQIQFDTYFEKCENEFYERFTLNQAFFKGETE